jgi:hypothetical protein
VFVLSVLAKHGLEIVREEECLMSGLSNGGSEDGSYGWYDVARAVPRLRELLLLFLVYLD